MEAYVDSSVVLRVALHEPRPLASWRRLTSVWTSELTRVECFRVLDRARHARRLDDLELARARNTMDEIFGTVQAIDIDRRILRRAAEPMPTALRTLDAIHVATALAVRSVAADLQVATHDEEMAIAAKALGFRVLGV